MELRLSYDNLNAPGGTFVTPVWFGLHDDGFDLFEIGEAASAGVEAVAEDGTFATVAGELVAADPDGSGGVIPQPPGPIGPGQSVNVVVDADAANQPLLSFIAMILPSNDAFIGTSDPLVIFEDGEFQGTQVRVLTGAMVYDAGTEVNTEQDAAFINQSAPDTGLDQGGVIAQHVGFIGSENHPTSEFPGMILGGETAVGAIIDPVAGDFTLDRDAPIGFFRVAEVVRIAGDETAERINAGGADLIIDAAAGNDTVDGGTGWDELFGGEGDDLLRGQGARDTLDGGEGDDRLFGGDGDDNLLGGDGADRLFGQDGDDTLDGGADRDVYFGGDGNDTFVLTGGADVFNDFTLGEDTFGLSGTSLSFADLSFSDVGSGAAIEAGGERVALVVGVSSADLTEDLFV